MLKRIKSLTGLLPRSVEHRLSIFVNRGPIWRWIEENDPDRILEVGLGDGINARKMIELAGDCDYYCFESLEQPRTHEPYRDLSERGNTHFFIGDSKETMPEVAPELPEMDLIFIDGGHDYETVRSDWNHMKGLMHGETVCFFHDVTSRGPKAVVEGIGLGFSKRGTSSPNLVMVTRVEAEG